MIKKIILGLTIVAISSISSKVFVVRRAARVTSMLSELTNENRIAGAGLNNGRSLASLRVVR